MQKHPVASLGFEQTNQIHESIELSLSSRLKGQYWNMVEKVSTGNYWQFWLGT